KRGSRRLDRRAAGQRDEGGRGIQCTDGAIREPGAGGRDRSDQGGPLGVAERRIDRVAAPDDRGGHLADSRKESERCVAGWWHGGHVLTSVSIMSLQARVRTRAERACKECGNRPTWSCGGPD